MLFFIDIFLYYLYNFRQVFYLRARSPTTFEDSTMRFEEIFEMAEKVFDEAGLNLDGTSAQPCAVVIDFRSDEMLSLCYSRFKALMPELSRYGNRLAGIARDYSEADLVVKRIRGVVNAFNRTLLGQQIYPEWLEDYLGYRSFGIESVGVADDLTNESDITGYFLELDRKTQFALSYEDQREVAEGEAAHYTEDRLIRDFSVFFEDNGIGFQGGEQLRGMFTSMADQVKRYFADNPDALTLNAHEGSIYGQSILSKQEVLWGDTFEQDAAEESYFLTTGSLDAKASKTRLYVMGELTKSLAQSILPDLSIKGLDERLVRELDDADLDEVRLSAGFTGIDLYFIEEGDRAVDEVLSVPNLHHVIRKRKGSFSQILAGVFADYLLIVLEMKNNVAFCDELIRIAGNLDKEPFDGDLEAIAQKTRTYL